MGSQKSMPEAYENALEKLRNKFEVEPVEFPMTQKMLEYLTEHPEKRAEEIMEASKRDDIKGAIAVAGGSGEQIRILKHIWNQKF